MKESIQDRKSSQMHASDEHQNFVELSALAFKGSINVIRGNSNIKGKYFPDVIAKDSDIEIEIMPKSYIAKKIAKWNKDRGKILVLGLSRIASDNFNEVYAVNSNKELVRLK